MTLQRVIAHMLIFPILAILPGCVFFNIEYNVVENGETWKNGNIRDIFGIWTSTFEGTSEEYSLFIAPIGDYEISVTCFPVSEERLAGMKNDEAFPSEAMLLRGRIFTAGNKHLLLLHAIYNPEEMASNTFIFLVEMTSQDEAILLSADDNITNIINKNISVEDIENNLLDMYIVTVPHNDLPDFLGILLENTDVYFSDPMKLTRSAGMVFNSDK